MSFCVECETQLSPDNWCYQCEKETKPKESRERAWGQKRAPLDLFKTARELSLSEPDRPEWIFESYLARGTIWEIDGKQKIGKSTLLGKLFAAILQGKQFLGLACAKSPIILLTEERRPTVIRWLKRCGLDNAADLYILRKQDCYAENIDWTGSMLLARQLAQDIGAVVIVVDTLSRWADVRNENDTGEMMVAMEPVEQAANAGFALILARHDRKSGGSVGDSGRGNTQISGTVDTISHLENPRVNGHPNRRTLSSIGRFDETPEQLVIELSEAGDYINLGEKADVERQMVREVLIDTLPFDPEQAMRMAEIQDLEALRSFSRTTIQRSIESLEREGFVQHRQLSTSGRPKVYWRGSLSAHIDNTLGQRDTLL